MIEVLRITTQRGSTYDFTQDYARVRRVCGADSRPLRGDGEWLDVMKFNEAVSIGKRLDMMLGEPTRFWQRITSVVTSIETVEIPAD